MQGRDLAVMLVMMFAFATAAWLFYLVYEDAKRKGRLKAQADLNARLLDKFGSPHEVVEFLQTPAGSQFVESMSSDQEEPSSAIMRSTHRGIILVVLSAGVLGLAWYYRLSENPLLPIGVVLLCLGIGFLVSAAVSHRLSKSLGILHRQGKPQQ